MARGSENQSTEAARDGRLAMRAENVRPGTRLGPIFYVVSADQIAAFAKALGGANPVHGGADAIAPPTMRLLDYALLIAMHFKGGKGGVHAKHWCEYFAPIRAGQAVRVDGIVTDAAPKRGKFYFTLEYETRDAASGELLTRQAITSVLLNEKGEMA
ncbi:MAG TPA: MaoC family dehydratase N-terminal domain-containing protein [Candidatus Binataceae bacterium]|nr:MaoC family dehydratase N-terminal domain-containing protein [Candidatus Binataceae bacterium]